MTRIFTYLTILFCLIAFNLIQNIDLEINVNYVLLVLYQKSGMSEVKLQGSLLTYHSTFLWKGYSSTFLTLKLVKKIYYPFFKLNFNVDMKFYASSSLVFVTLNPNMVVYLHLPRQGQFFDSLNPRLLSLCSVLFSSCYSCCLETEFLLYSSVFASAGHLSFLSNIVHSF